MVLLEIGIGVVVIIIGGILVIIWNTLVMMKNNVAKAWANIDVLLEQRHDELGKLIDTVKGYKNYEKTILTKLTGLRTKWMSIPKDDIQGKADASNQISQALKSIFATSENYPDLKADQSFLQLQTRISELETQIAERREFYNDSANEYNIKIAQIPYVMFANGMGYKPVQLFQVPDASKQDVKVNL
ncbi:MAG: LemA family protein [Candidatus Micrarchaeota archaeon]|nr:LemA family protein [Candidatus Micrarchaeota archaeon]